MKRYVTIFGIGLLFFSCYKPYHFQPQKIAGYKAVYSNDPQLRKIMFLPPRSMAEPGKIYVKNNMILQNDIGSGIHIVDATDPSTLVKRGFIQVAGNLELSIKGSFLYVNSYADLVVIDLRNWNDLREVKRVPGAFSQLTGASWTGSYIAMPEKNAYYECVDAAKGLHIGWQKDTLINECAFYNF